MSIPGAGLVIRQWREKKGQSQRHIAQKLRCSQQYVALVEAGIRPFPVTWLPLLPAPLRELIAPLARASLEKMLATPP